ncbi:ADP-heptose--LPS heptosyltransferase [[Actinobacillus] muris]|uniref:Lipopolysaccharide heptosyltransferase 1 n=1 Tax=Muribacter muris TaxID=67855 RepID=A0A0J5S1F6_9PAST|nr:lipopolysaccharide heptosyltransferase RfaC [Muribacter muris]KMK50697.1 ADP-heptose--LPS heptosyltransferase [[Actinobacillus] muris] [Muribacter muris]
MKICLVKTSSMGDVIHALPALTDAQRAIPNLQVDWVVEPAFAEIPRWHSAVQNVIPIALRRWRKHLFQRQTWRQWFAYKQQLQATDYDAVIDAQGLLKSALFATRLARGQKFGYDKQSAREGLSHHCYDHAFHIPYQQHAVERIRQLFAAALGYRLAEKTGDYGIAHHFTKNQADQTAYLIAIHATTRPDKHWLESHWRTTLQALTNEGRYICLPWGNEAERQRAERLAQGNPQIQVLPKLSLTALATQIALAQAVISVDTGLSHLAAALDKPNVILYGATDPKLIGAYGKNQHYLTAQGMANISPNQVLEKLAVLG